MSGLLALLDDVAALAKLAAAQVDDVASQAARVSAKVAVSVLDDAAKAGSKSLGVVIDDAAVTPKYVQGLPAARELPIVWQIARGSLFNKIVVLLPLAILLNLFLPWLLTPLLMLGGAYLCYEGAERVMHLLVPGPDHGPQPETLDAAHLERDRVTGAIKTDFILSAEIMTIALAAVEAPSVWVEIIVLALVAIGITALVYGSVAVLVKADDVGLQLAQSGRLRATRALGHAIVRAMPPFMVFIATVGTAAMLWVGGSIVIHGLDVMGMDALAHAVHEIALLMAGLAGFAAGALAWISTAALDGLFGLALGLVLVPVVHYAVLPLAGLVINRN